MFSPVAPKLTALAIDKAANGDNQLIAAQPNQRIAVYMLWFVAIAGVSFKFKKAAADLHPAIPLAASEKFKLDLSEEPYFVTGTNEALTINLSGAIQVSGMLYYTLIT